MGVSLSKLVNGDEITLNSLSDKCIALDAYNTLYQFLSTIRQQDGTPLMNSKGIITSHLSGLFYRTLRLLEANITPVYIFDGAPPKEKYETIQARKLRRSEAEAKWQEALREGDIKTANKYAKQSTRLNKEQVKDCKRLLDALGVPNHTASSEGEAQAAYMVKKGIVYASASQDYDSLLFGASRLVRYISATKSGFRKRSPEIFHLGELLNMLEINHEQLIMLGILVGTDFNPGGIHGIGPKKAIKLVKKEKTWSNIETCIEWPFETPAERIIDIFLNPEVKDIPFPALNPFDKDKVVALLCDEFEFSYERISTSLKKYEDLREKRQQTNLSAWF